MTTSTNTNTDLSTYIRTHVKLIAIERHEDTKDISTIVQIKTPSGTMYCLQIPLVYSPKLDQYVAQFDDSWLRGDLRGTKASIVDQVHDIADKYLARSL